MIDTHCHLYDKKLIHKLNQIIENAYSANIEKMICIGDTLGTSDKSIQIAEKYNNIYASVGIHPHESKLAPENYLSQIKQKVKHHKVVAIGEIGLDYYYNLSDKKHQKPVFLEQLKLAKQLDLPAIVHCRNAEKDVYDTILKSKHNQGVIHCFSGTMDFAKKIIDLGYYISFTGMITFVKELENVIEEISLENIMIETDAPYLAPVPYRGKVNQPAFVQQVAKKISDIKNISIKEVERITTINAKSLFKKLAN